MRTILVVFIMLYVVPFPQTWARINILFLMVARGGGPARGPNNPLNNRSGVQKTKKKADLVLAKEQSIKLREAAKEKERIDTQIEREEKKKLLAEQNEARKAIAPPRE